MQGVQNECVDNWRKDVEDVEDVQNVSLSHR